MFPVQLLIEASKTAGTQAKKKARMARCFWFDRTLNQQMQLYDVIMMSCSLVPFASRPQN